MTPALSIESLSFSYRGSEKQALKDLEGQIEEGSFVALMGQGGAGKSTLCCATNGLVPRFFRGDYKGRLLVNGLDVTGCNIVELSRMVGLVLQDFEAQLFCTNVELEVAFGPENQGISREMIGQRVDRHLGFVGLGSMRRRDSATLSGGQKQRLAIGSILAMEPRVLVMDEPVTDLDPKGRADILSISDRLWDRAQTLIVADNEPENVIKADRLWLMRDGGIAAQGLPEEVLSDLPLLQSCGIMVPPTVAFFRAMNWPGAPLTFEDAQMLIKRHNYVSRRDRLPDGDYSEQQSRGPILKARDLSFRYPGSPDDSLQNVDLDINEGEFIAILGKNGSGKTTLAQQFNGLLKPTSGVMFANNKPTTAHRARDLARLVGYVFQNPDHQIFAATVRDEVSFGPRMLGQDHKSIEENLQRALAATGLEGYEDASPFVLTKGERQRVAVASVLAVRPPVIVLDEPTTGLDYCHQLETMKMLRSLNEKGHTIIIITHTMWIAESFARRCIVMNNGRVIADGPTRAVFSDEDKLHEASLAPSPLVRLSNWLGTQSLTAEELALELGS